MVKKLLAIIALFVPVVVFAATTDFVANGNITVSGVTFGSGTANMIILSGSQAQSWTFSSGAFTVINPGSAFQVGSSNSSVKSIQVSQSGTTLVCQENSTPGTSAVTLPTTAGTYTVSPSATTQCTSLCTALSNVASYNSFPTCGAASCNAGYTLSGSGASATCVAVGGGGPQGLVGSCSVGYTLSGNLCIPNSSKLAVPTPGATATPVQATVSAVFTTTMSFGMTSGDIRRLQTLLAMDKGAYPEGTISGYYGVLTQKAVQRFQLKYGVAALGDSGYGVAGPKTRAKLQEVFGGNTGASSPATALTSPLFTSNLTKGMKSSDVYRLQQLLARNAEIYPEGTLSGYFGSLTEAAVQRFQLKYGVVNSAKDEGYGLVGPKTRAKLQEVFGR